MKKIMKNIFILFLFIFSASYVYAQDINTARVENGQYAIRTMKQGDKDSTFVQYFETARTIYYFDSITSVSIVDTIFYIPDGNAIPTITGFTDKFTAYLFECDGIWEDSIFIDVDNILIGQYGVGTPPTFNGSKEITTWEVDTGYVWKSKLDFELNHLIIDDELPPISSWPETGWLNVDTVNVQNKQVISSHIGDKGVDWTGAYIGELAVAWSAEYRKIVDVSGDTLTFTGDDIYALSYTDSFRIVNAKEAMTFAGSWYFNPIDSMLYWWPTNNDNPSNYEIYGSHIVNGVFGEELNNIVIKDVVFKNYTNDGIYLKDNCSNIEVNGCKFLNNYETGVVITDDMYYDTNNLNIHILYNTVRGSNKNGIYLKSDSALIQNNIVEDISLLKQHNWKGQLLSNGSGCGIIGYPIKNSVIKWNNVNNIGYNGIMYHSDSTKTDVYQNVVRNYCQSFGDGGGIYTHLVHNGSIISENIVYNDVQQIRPIIGIYLDAKTTSVIVRDNLSMHNRIGFHINNMGDVTIDGNTLFNNNSNVSGSSQLSIKEYNRNNNSGTNIFKDNICISTADAPNRSLYISCYNVDNARITMENNIFGMPRSTDMFLYQIDAPQIFNSSASISDIEGYLNQTNIGERANISNYENVEIFFNQTFKEQEQDLENSTWVDLDGNTVTSLTLEPFTSKILIKE